MLQSIPTIPTYITVHLGRPNTTAQNVTITFPDYIKNVASSEIYPTWPENALRANIYAQVTFALNRVFTEWYRSRGYDFDITNSTQYDQAYVHGRDIFQNVSEIVDELFNDYIRRQGSIEPLFAQFCNGTTVTCEGLSQWGTVTLARQGQTPYEILTYYYGNDIDIVFNAPVMARIPSYPGSPLRLGSRGGDVRAIQVRLNRISRNYPRIPKVTVDGIFGPATESAVRTFQQVFNLTADGIVGKATWYKIAYLYVSVKRLAELNSEGLTIAEFSQQYPDVLRVGDRGNSVRVLQYYLLAASNFNNLIPPVAVDGIFGSRTEQAVIAYQRAAGLTPDGVVGRQTWDALYRNYQGIRSRVLNGDEVAEPVQMFPGQVLSQGSSGSDVATLQYYLAFISTIFPEIPRPEIDGEFGPETKEAVRVFQREAGLTPDGIVGPVTWDTIASAYEDLRSGLQRMPGQYPGYVIREEEA